MTYREATLVNNSDWERLARALREMHSALVVRARTDYLREHAIDGDISPGELLRLLTSDPYFEWLRSLSELMVDIDAVSDQDDHQALVQSGTIRAAVEYLVAPPAPSDPPSAFAKRYWPYVQDDPHVGMAHGELKRALSTWPAAEKTDRRSLSDHRIAVRERARARR